MGWVQTHPTWVLGFEDEVWWSREAQPHLHAWSEAGQPLRLVEQSVAKTDPDPKALACYGLLVRWPDATGRRQEAAWLRFVDGRPVSAVTTQFLAWCCRELARAGTTALALVWDNASWHRSRAVRAWIAAHNRQVKQTQHGVRIVPCFLPTKSPWLNAIEPKWVHGKRRVVEPARLLTATELEARVCAAFGCSQEDHLAIPERPA
jgi:DDE superfamily endonuclease